MLLSCLFISAKSFGGGMEAYMRNCVFLDSHDSAYVETQFTIATKYLKLAQRDDKKYEAAVEVILLYEKDSTIIKHLKYLLFSEPMTDTSMVKFNLADLKRVALPDGDYSVSLYLEDFYDSTSHTSLAEGLSIHFNQDSLEFSDIELVESYSASESNSIYTKHGYEILPYTIQYYPTSIVKMTFYAEIYHSDKYFGAENFLASVYIRESLTGKPLENFVFNLKQAPEPRKILFSSFDISELPSGKYYLTIELRSKQNKFVAANNLFFVRSNKAVLFQPQQLDSVQVEKLFSDAVNSDSLNFFLQSLYPIAGNEEKNYIDYFRKSTDTTAMNALLYKFWLRRNALNPLGQWLVYRGHVYEAESEFKTQTRHGYDTDRGRIYLQYGSPDEINRSSQEPGTYPYEVWHYYFLPPSQSNVHFVFYNKDLVSNNYKLLHSDAIGEIKNPRWQFMLNDAFKNKNGVNNPDVTEFPDSWGSHVDDFMK